MRSYGICVGYRILSKLLDYERMENGPIWHVILE